jgi:hypothetical protein
MKSIFDGWTKKIEHRAIDMNGGFCMAGYLAYVKLFTIPQMVKTAERIGKWIQSNFEAPKIYRDSGGFALHPKTSPRDACIWANNECILDIEGFKRADIESRRRKSANPAKLQKEARHG